MPFVIPSPDDATAGDSIRGKWMLDGATSLAEAADLAHAAAEALQALHDDGWTLSGPIEDDYGYLVDPAGIGAEDED